MKKNKLEIAYEFIIRKKTLYFLFSVSLILFAISLWNRYIQIDENYFGEQAYWLINDGVVKLKSWPGISHFDIQMLFYHKLFTWIATSIVMIFGWSIYPLKTFSLLMLALFFYVYYKYYKNNNSKITYEQIVVAALIFMLTPEIIIKGFTFRQEIFVMTVGFCSYYFINEYIKANKIKHIVLGSIFAGLAFLITPNGFLFLVSGGILLLFKKKFKIIPLYGIIVTSISLFFLIDILPDKWDEFVYQFKNYPLHNLGEIYMPKNIWDVVVMKLINITKEHQRFFWSDKVAITSAMFVFSLLLFFRKIYREHKSMVIYLISLIVTLNIFGSLIVERYLLYYMPFIALIIAFGITEVKKRKKYNFARILYMLLLIAAIGVSGLQYSKIFSRSNNHAEIHKELLSKINYKNENILVPWAFIYNEIGNYNLVAYKAMEYREDKLEKKWTQEEFLKIAAEELNIGYIIANKTILKEDDNYDWLENGIINDNPYFIRYFKHGEFLVLKRK